MKFRITVPTLSFLESDGGRKLSSGGLFVEQFLCEEERSLLDTRIVQYEVITN